jgi:hypothetical protein
MSATPIIPTTYAYLVMKQAIVDIDNLFGTSYAKAHPELVAAYMQTEVTLRGQNVGVAAAT